MLSHIIARAPQTGQQTRYHQAVCGAVKAAGTAGLQEMLSSCEEPEMGAASCEAGWLVLLGRDALAVPLDPTPATAGQDYDPS